MVLTWIPEGRGGVGAQSVLEIQMEWEGGGGQKYAFCRGGVDFFWNNTMRVIFDSNRTETKLALKINCT